MVLSEYKNNCTAVQMGALIWAILAAYTLIQSFKYLEDSHIFLFQFSSSPLTPTLNLYIQNLNKTTDTEQIFDLIWKFLYQYLCKS